MAHQWSSKSRAKSRSPAPLRTPTIPSQFFPPSHFAAAAGVPYPPSRDDDGTPQFRTPSTPAGRFQQEMPSLSSPLASNPSRPRRRSRLDDLGLLEPHLLPTLSDTVERMTRPPSQAVPNSPSPFGPSLKSDFSVSPAVARTPSTSSQSSSAYSVRSEHHGAVTKQVPPRSPHNAQLEQQLPSSVRPSLPKSNPKSILKSHTTSDQHLQVRKTHLVDPPTHKTTRSPIPIPLDPLSDRKVEQTFQVTPSPRPRIDSSLRTGRARSRTDPGTSSHGRTTQQTNSQPSAIPRRVEIEGSSPATSRIPTAGAQTSNSGSDVATANLAQREKRRLFVTNAEISSSSSTESRVPLARFIKPKMLARTDSQSSAESQLRPPRFGLGLGLSGVNEPRNQDKLSPSQRWTAKIPSDGSVLRRSNSPSNKKGQRDGTPKRRDRSPSKNLRIDGADGQRRRRELLSLVPPDLNDSSGCDSRPSSSDGSGDSLRSAFDDSGSEYSPAEEDIRQASTRRPRQARSKAMNRQHRVDPTDDGNDPPIHVDEQYTPRASSNPTFSQQGNVYSVTGHDEEPLETESSTLASDGEAGSINETLSPTVPQRYSSELSRIMAVSMVAASRQQQAFGISSTLDLEDRQTDSSELPPTDSDLSLIGGDRWQDECDELATGSLLQRLDRSRGADDRESANEGQRTSTGELSLSSAQTRTSFSQESIYSTPNSPKRRVSTGIVIPDSPPAVPTVHEQLWQNFERHLLDTYGDIEVRRQRFVWELTESEDGFVKQLQNMIQLFILPLRVRDTRMWVSGIPSDVTKLFDWLDDIVRIHAQLSAALSARQIVDHPRLQIISEVFRGFIPRLETYQPYLVKLEFTASVIDSLIHEGRNDFGDFIKLQEASERCRGWCLERYLIEPVNRLAQYPEMFRRFLQLTPKSHPDYMSTLSLFHTAKLTIRVLSEVKDREDAYEFVKVTCSSIKGISPAHLVHRARCLLIQGPLTCIHVSDDVDSSSLNARAEYSTMPHSDVSLPQEHTRRADKLSNAVRVWRGRSNSVKSTASTVVSFGTAPSSFDVLGGPASTPAVRVESEPVDVAVFVFTDLVLLATRLSSEREHAHALVPLDRFGLTRVVSVLDEIDRRGRITLELAPLTARALEEGYVQSTGSVVTISLARPRGASGEQVALGDWLAPLQRCRQYTHRALVSLHTTHALVDRAASDAAAQKPVVSLLAAGLPMPKSPSMQMDESERGVTRDSERQEREERGWWSTRFHEVFGELSKQEAGSV